MNCRRTRYTSRGTAPGRSDRRSITIDLIWETVRGPALPGLARTLIASHNDAYLRDSIRAVNARLTESMEKTLSGSFGPSTSSVPNLDLFPGRVFLMMEGLAIGAQAREKAIVEQVLGAAKNLGGALFTRRSAG